MTAHRVKAMFHSTAMVQDYDRTVARMAELFGLRVLEYSEADNPAIGRRGGMTWVGDGSIELCEPTFEGAAPDRFVRRTGGGMQGVALWVDNFEATIKHLAAHDVAMPVTLGHFGFSSPRSTAGLQFEWSESTVDEDPRAGAPEPAFVVTPQVDVTHHAFVGAVVDDPIATAGAIADAFDVPVTFTAPEADAGTPVAGLGLRDCTLALFALDPDESEALWGRSHDRPRVSLLGLRVDDLAVARAALLGASVELVRETPDMLVLRPETAGDLEVVVVADLLPGDPRL